MASGGDDKKVKLWDMTTRQLKTELPGHKSVVKSLAFSPDGRILASGSGDDTVKLWDLETGEELETLTGHSGGVWAVAFPYLLLVLTVPFAIVVSVLNGEFGVWLTAASSLLMSFCYVILAARVTVTYLRYRPHARRDSEVGTVDSSTK